MKILCFIDSLAHGGAQRQLVILAALLKEAGYDIKVAYYHDLDFYKNYLDEHHIENHLIKGAGNAIKRFTVVNKFLKKENPDIVIAYLDTPSIVACVAKMLGGEFKLIVSERNTTQKLGLSERAKFFLDRWADAIVTNSFSQEIYIRQHFKKLANKVSTITNCLDISLFYPAKVKPNNPRPILITVGRVVAQKNVKHYIEAVKLLTDSGLDFEVRWYGCQDGKYFEECSQMVKEKGLNDRFYFFAPDSNISERYREADIFVLPSIYEGFPNVLCEAMACGLTCIASNVCDNSIILNDSKFLFNPDDLAGIALRVEQTIKMDHKQREEIGQRNVIDAKELCDTKKFVDKYISLIQLMNLSN